MLQMCSARALRFKKSGVYVVVAARPHVDRPTHCDRSSRHGEYAHGRWSTRAEPRARDGDGHALVRVSLGSSRSRTVARRRA
jgi:hypothetical protein